MTKCLSPWSTLSLYLSYFTATSTLLQEHRCLLKRLEGKAREHHRMKGVIYLCACLFIFSVTAMSSESGTWRRWRPPGERAKDLWARMLEWMRQSGGCLVSELTESKKRKEKQNVPRLCVVICAMHVEWKCWNMQYEEKAADWLYYKVA